jgi:hypothetical protein
MKDEASGMAFDEFDAKIHGTHGSYEDAEDREDRRQIWMAAIAHERKRWVEGLEALKVTHEVMDEPKQWKNLHASFLKIRQISPDTWKAGPIILDVTESTTIGEVIEWFSRNAPGCRHMRVDLIGSLLP